MEQLAAKQVTISQEMSKLLENIKKEPKERRTTEQIAKRYEQLQKLWGAFQAHHEEIAANYNQPEHEYFKQAYYTQVKNFKTKIEDTLSAFQAANTLESEQMAETSKGQSQTAESTKSSETFLRRKRERLRMEAFHQQLSQVDTSKLINIAIIDYHIKSLTESWTSIKELHEEVLVYSHIEDLATAEMQELLNKFEEQKLWYNEMMFSLEEKKLTVANQCPSENDIRLPRLTIPTFDGKYDSWRAFHDIFSRLIHNNKKLANVEKMQYLKTSLRAEALQLLSHLEISDSNYESAWTMINNRYNNKRKLASTQIQAILSLPKLEYESSSGIKRIHDTVKECLHALSNIGIDTNSWAPMIVHIILQKVDIETHRLYEQALEDPKELPTLEIFFKFMESRFQSLEALNENKRRENNSWKTKGYKPVEKPRNPVLRNYHNTAVLKCAYCQKQHLIYSCSEFQALSVNDRINFITGRKLCPNCLNHEKTINCHSRHRCSYCQQKHHSLLHNEIQKNVKPVNSNKREQFSVQTHFAEQNHTVLLATALINIRAANGKYELVRALIDPGSQGTFVTENVAQLLEIPKTRIHAQVAGLGTAITGTSRSKIQLSLQPRFPSSFQTTVDALVLPKLTKSLPEMEIQVDRTWENIILADPTFEKPGPIDVLLGADAYATILRNGVKKINKNLVIQNTELGWVILGQIQNSGNMTQVISMISQVEIDQQLRKFWEIEEVPTEQDSTYEEMECENHFMRTHTRNSDGTYTVRIPFKEQNLQLGESRTKALARLFQNEKKFLKNKHLEHGYKNFMAEYLQLQHMIPVEPQDYSSNAYYIPHQAVIKNDSTTTKLRVVFDASAKTSTGISLNDTMYSGPRLQRDISQLLLRWRKHRYVFTADIEKMYRQIKVSEHDQNYQRILWRFSPSEPIKEYKLTTVTYGTTAAPFLAIRILQQHAKNEEHLYPQEAKVVLRDFYVDDMMSGTNTIQEALTLQKNLIQLLAKGGFKLRKWTSNNPVLLQQIPKEMRESGILEITSDDTIKTLGIHWNPNADVFCFKVQVQRDQERPTKRTLLSEIAKIFDPLGWLTPVTIRAILCYNRFGKQK